MKHTFSNIVVHIIFSTKGRAPLLEERYRDLVHKYIGGIIRKEGGKTIEIGGYDDHVHVLAVLPPTKLFFEIVRKVKGGSSKWIEEQAWYNGKFQWQRGYSIFSVSESAVKDVKKYIKNQKRHHTKMSSEREFEIFLEKNGL